VVGAGPRTAASNRDGALSTLTSTADCYRRGRPGGIRRLPTEDEDLFEVLGIVEWRESLPRRATQVAFAGVKRWTDLKS
jgi:hypothetical protein